MRKLIVSTFLTLDRVMQAPSGQGEDDSTGDRSVDRQMAEAARTELRIESI
jgi:hypothetical protein